MVYLYTQTAHCRKAVEEFKTTEFIIIIIVDLM
jgi:hypothetical protein